MILLIVKFWADPNVRFKMRSSRPEFEIRLIIPRHQHRWWTWVRTSWLTEIQKKINICQRLILARWVLSIVNLLSINMTHFCNLEFIFSMYIRNNNNVSLTHYSMTISWNDFLHEKDWLPLKPQNSLFVLVVDLMCRVPVWNWDHCNSNQESD